MLVRLARIEGPNYQTASYTMKQPECMTATTLQHESFNLMTGDALPAKLHAQQPTPIKHKRGSFMTIQVPPWCAFSQPPASLQW